MLSRRLRLASLALALIAPALARAQTPDAGLRIRAARRDTIRAGATATAAFVVSSTRADSVDVMPHVDMPQEWSVLMGGSPFPLRAGATEMLMLSVAVPARAVAGVYPVRVSLTTGSGERVAVDSIAVIVPPRRALEVGLVDRPGFIVSGKSYTAGFVVRNRGNTPAEVRVRARSSLGAVGVADTTIRLDAEESRMLRPSVLVPAGFERAMDDVLEMTVDQTGDTAAAVTASARVTIVPEPTRKIEEYLRLPTNLRLRGATSSGVAPFEAAGHGFIRDGGRTQLDFFMRGPTGKFAAFGEREEYRVDLSAPNWRARFGDQIFMLTPLTGGAQPGFGAGGDMTRGRISAGAYGQQFRRTSTGGSEAGAFVATTVSEGASVGLNMATRAGGLLEGQVGSATARFQRPTYSADAELARSNSATGAGLARSARVSGATDAFTYDVSHIFADTGFAGSQRGSEHDYVTASLHQLEWLSVAVNAGTHRTDLSRSTGVPYTQRLDVGLLSATLFGRYTLESNATDRQTTVSGLRTRDLQRGLRARADQDFIFGLATFEGEVGTSRESSANRTYTDLSLSARHAFERGTLGLWTNLYSGGALTKGAQGTVTFGGDATYRLSPLTDFTLMAFATRLRGSAAEWNSQIDALIGRQLPNGNRISLRARIIGGGSIPVADQSVAYLEYGMPLRLPISKLRTTGRVYGRVVDATSGRGVPNALVRLGPQVAITDKEGQVAFGGVPGGEHRLSMSQETSFADAVFVGDPTLMVDSTRTSPTTFQLAIARSARVTIDVRRFAMARTGIGSEPDSLVEAGALANATLVLSGERDTLYRTTGQNGQVSFTDVPPGKWTIAVRGDAPAYHRFEPDRMEITLAPGEAKAVSFRLVPRRREVQIIGGDQELVPMTAEPKAQAPQTGTKTGKPNEGGRQLR